MNPALNTNAPANPEYVVLYGVPWQTYEETPRSAAFPFVTSGDVTQFLNKRHDMDEHSVVRAFVKWARKAHRQA